MTAGDAPSQSLRCLIPIDKLPAVGSRALWRHGELTIALLNVAGQLHALDDSCPHGGGSLVMGQLDGPWLRCPAHGLKFDIRTGCHASNSGLRVQTYPVVTEGGHTFIQLPSHSEPTTS